MIRPKIVAKAIAAMGGDFWLSRHRVIVNLTDQELADLIRAMEDAQAELCVGNPGGDDPFPEETDQWHRWEKLIQRFSRMVPIARKYVPWPTPSPTVPRQ